MTGQDKGQDNGACLAAPGSREPSRDASRPQAASIPRVIHVWFADNGNIRKWATEPFGEGAPYYVEGDRVCADCDSNGLCGCVTIHAREIMQHWTGTNCTWVDDDITALGILAGHAIRAGLHREAAIPDSMKRAIDKFTASGIEARSDETPQEVRPEGQEPGGEAETPSPTPENPHDR